MKFVKFLAEKILGNYFGKKLKNDISACKYQLFTHTNIKILSKNKGKKAVIFYFVLQKIINQLLIKKKRKDIKKRKIKNCKQLHVSNKNIKQRKMSCIIKN